MAIKLKPSRQDPIIATVPFVLADLTSGTAVPAVQLPANARIKSVILRIDTAVNSGTTDALVVQSNEGTPKSYVSISAAANAVTTGIYTAVSSANLAFLNLVQSTLDIKWTGTGTAATTGAGVLIVEYVVEGRAEFTQG